MGEADQLPVEGAENRRMEWNEMAAFRRSFFVVVGVRAEKRRSRLAHPCCDNHQHAILAAARASVLCHPLHAARWPWARRLAQPWGRSLASQLCKLSPLA